MKSFKRMSSEFAWPLVSPDIIVGVYGSFRRLVITILISYYFGVVVVVACGRGKPTKMAIF